MQYTLIFNSVVCGWHVVGVRWVVKYVEGVGSGRLSSCVEHLNIPVRLHAELVAKKLKTLHKIESTGTPPACHPGLQSGSQYSSTCCLYLCISDDVYCLGNPSSWLCVLGWLWDLCAYSSLSNVPGYQYVTCATIVYASSNNQCLVHYNCRTQWKYK